MKPGITEGKKRIGLRRNRKEMHSNDIRSKYKACIIELHFLHFFVFNFITGTFHLKLIDNIR